MRPLFSSLLLSLGLLALLPIAPAHAFDQTQAEIVDIIIPEMHCVGCANAIRQNLLEEPNVSSVSFTFREKRITAITRPGTLSDEQIKRVVGAMKYEATQISRRPPDAAPR